MEFKPQNILVIDFGQLGDVVLSLPALRAIREKFPAAKITVAVGKSCAQLIDLAEIADDKIVVDRVKLRDSNKFWSILQMGKLVKDVRAKQFDFVIDLHSLTETNLLGFASGAGKRLFARRDRRSIDFLSSFAPPKEDRRKHATDRYLDVLKPLEIEDADHRAILTPRREDLEFTEKLWEKHKLEGLTVGLFPGAGHPSRRWQLEKFGELADFLARNDGIKIAVFLGPEERNLEGEIKQKFPQKTVVFDKLSLPQLIAAQQRLSVFVSNDTGPMHLAAAVGTPVVLLLDAAAPLEYLPITERLKYLQKGKITELEVEDVYAAVREMLAAERVSRLNSV